ncbi:GatB/YqeY domain-containing protein [Nocardia sp. CNY236]|uniref:GatB/YqeY domain-containing protein n=1 Tax=Nocardia sp. CNY236 TaxID=1169152 RepID=UPI00055C4E72|nr:GatB/YqeY domain-containing protein [Nocardia sp. CNY236]
MSLESSSDRPALRERMRSELFAAMKSRDRTVSSALRSALGAVDDAEAVEVAGPPAGALENSPTGLGVAEAAPRELTEDDVERIVRAEIDERLSAARQFEAHGRTDRAAVLHAEAKALTDML